MSTVKMAEVDLTEGGCQSKAEMELGCYRNTPIVLHSVTTCPNSGRLSIMGWPGHLKSLIFVLEDVKCGPDTWLQCTLPKNVNKSIN